MYFHFRVLISAFITLTVLHLSVAAQPNSQPDFLKLVQKQTENRGSCKRSAACTCSLDDEVVALQLLSEYGSIFAGSGSLRLPDRCIFEDQKQVEKFQRKVRSQVVIIGGVAIELQEEAVIALLAAQRDAVEIGLRITPLDGAVAGKRSHPDTIRIWNSRFLKALNHWVRLRRISADEADDARSADVIKQIRLVMEWERDGMNFGTNMKRSIFASTAPPGTSQHLSMLAFDVVQHANRKVREILNTHGWYQTVANDAPHFTYLGLPETELPARGLTAKYLGGQKYWLPNLKLSE